MGNIYAFLLIFPMLMGIFFKSVAFYEYSTKEMYLKNLCDTLSYKVKITGVLKQSEYNEFKTKIAGLSEFNDTSNSKGVFFEWGEINSNGDITNIKEYNVGYQLKKGDVFAVAIKSSTVCNYSRLENWGVSSDNNKNLYYYAKGVCRVEQVLQ